MDLVREDPTRIIHLARSLPLESQSRAELYSNQLPAYSLGGDWDKDVSLLASYDIYQAVRSYVRDRAPIVESDYAARCERTLANGRRIKYGARSVVDLAKRLEARARHLAKEFSHVGYLAKSHGDEIGIVYNRQGHPLFYDGGAVRISVAHEVELRSAVCRVIARHSEWAAFRDEMFSLAARRRGGRLYQRLEHPDLYAVPHQYGSARAEIVLRALGKPGNRATALDIGAYWGGMCHHMSRAGYQCTAVEFGDNSKITERLRDVAGLNFDVVRANALDLPVWDAEAIVALNVLHHLAKTKSSYNKLHHCLKHCTADRLVLETLDPATEKVPNCYRTWNSPRALAEWVAKVSGLTDILEFGRDNTPRGNASHGREIFLLVRPSS